MPERYFLLILACSIPGLAGLAIPSPCPARWPLDRKEGRRRDRRPIFRLEVDSTQSGYRPLREYSMSVKGRRGRALVSDMFVAAEAMDDKCEPGEFKIKEPFLYQAAHCPSVVTYGRKEALRKVPLHWIAPTCGCVTVRATVKSTKDQYYYDPDDIIRGPLTKTICPEGVTPPESLGKGFSGEEGILPGSKGPNHDDDGVMVRPIVQNRLPQMSRDKRIHLLCHVSKTFSGYDLVQGQGFLQRRQMINLKRDWREELEMALEQRRVDVTRCCAQDGLERSECFSDIRRHRIDNFCGTGEPDVPFTIKREKWMKERQGQCCWKLGESRYDCFLYLSNSRIAQLRKSGHWSLDEADPANDIEDYPTGAGESMAGQVSGFGPTQSSSTSSRNHTNRDTADKNLHKNKDTHTRKSNRKMQDEIAAFSSRKEKSKDYSHEAIQQLCCEAGGQVGLKVTSMHWFQCSKASKKYKVQFQRRRHVCNTFFLMCCVETSIRGSSSTLMYTTTETVKNVTVPGIRTERSGQPEDYSKKGDRDKDTDDQDDDEKNNDNDNEDEESSEIADDDHTAKYFKRLRLKNFKSFNHEMDDGNERRSRVRTSKKSHRRRKHRKRHRFG